jgi:DNA-binding MltR family transcriptional regulator
MSEPEDPDVLRAREIVIQVFDTAYDRLKFDHTELEKSLLEEASALSDYLRTCDSRTYCILAVSFMEDALRRLFVNRWNISKRSEHDRHFGSNGPLSTFSQRVLIAKGLGWIGEEAVAEAQMLRRLRNEFAHNHRLLSLHDPIALKFVNTLPHAELIWKGIETYDRCLQKADAEGLLRMRVFCIAIGLVSRLVKSSKLIAADLPPNWRNGSGYDGLTKVEQGFMDIMIQHCFGSLGHEFRFI